MNSDISVLVVDDDESYLKELTSFMKTTGAFSEVSFARDGEDALGIAAATNPDVIILDSVMPRLDGIGFLRRMRSELPRLEPIVIMSSDSRFSGMMQSAVRHGVSYFMLKPQSCADICETVRELFVSLGKGGKTRGAAPDSGSLENAAANFLHLLGVPAHLLGYNYLRAAIVGIAGDPRLLSPITKRLYPLLAREFDTSPGCIERSLRHAIKVSWQRGSKRLLSGVFGYTAETSGTHTPTNAEYIAMISDYFLRTHPAGRH